MVLKNYVSVASNSISYTACGTDSFWTHCQQALGDNFQMYQEKKRWYMIHGEKISWFCDAKKENINS